MKRISHRQLGPFFMNHHHYADDTQLFFSFHPLNFDSSIYPEMDMGPYLLTQPNPTHVLTQPIFISVSLTFKALFNTSLPG